jgi:hypothetical protein
LLGHSLSSIVGIGSAGVMWMESLHRQTLKERPYVTTVVVVMVSNTSSREEMIPMTLVKMV